MNKPLKSTSGLPHAAPVTTWLNALASPAPSFADELRRIYGTHSGILAERIALLRCTLERFGEEFGDESVRVFRAPSRINVRGMHVDTHGGYLNLLTHQREIVCVVAPAQNPHMLFVNVDKGYPHVSVDLEEASSLADLAEPWLTVIATPTANAVRTLHRSAWGRYLWGTVVRALRMVPPARRCGVHAAVGGDIPLGASLSSSAALCVAVMQALMGMMHGNMDEAQLVLAARDAEWFAGARTGTSDQTASVVGQRERMVHGALLAEDFTVRGLKFYPTPAEITWIVAHSHTKRELSGTHRAAYNQNRFAYSMALEIFRQELVHEGWNEQDAAWFDRLSRITPEALGGLAPLYNVLHRIPVKLALAELPKRYHLPDFHEVYARFFSGVPSAHVPKTVGLRGPLLFGIAESERARVFPSYLQSGDYAEAGKLMSLGHDGDRVRDKHGKPFERRADDEMILTCLAHEIPPQYCPGDYGASTPALDALVDAALDAGALGASLTGAGMGGVIIALCLQAEKYDVMAGLVRCLASPTYAALAHLPTKLSSHEAEASVMENYTIAGASEIFFQNAPAGT